LEHHDFIDFNTKKKKKEKKMEGRVHRIRPTLTPLLIVEFPLLYDHLDS
jgi:hypothetical protein